MPRLEVVSPWALQHAMGKKFKPINVNAQGDGVALTNQPAFLVDSANSLFSDCEKINWSMMPMMLLNEFGRDLDR